MSDVIITADKTPWYQWDTGLAVTVSGGDMTECHFANRKQGTAYVQAVIKGKAKVPDELLQVAAPIKAYGYISDGGGGQTYVEQSFDVIARNIPSDYTYTKTAQKTIRDAEVARDQAYAAANDILGVADEVVGFRNEAKASADAAKKSADHAEYHAGRAKTNADDASVAMANAQSFAKMSSVHATESEGSAKKSAQSASAAATSASKAAASASEAATSASEAKAAAGNAASEVLAATKANADAAAQSATDAATAKAGAETAATKAATSASNAAESATAAAKSASDAAASVDAINIIAPKTTTTSASAYGSSIAFGDSAQCAPDKNWAIAIGVNANVKSGGSIAIGSNAHESNEVNSANVAIGDNATIENCKYSIALGAYSKATHTSECSIGSPASVNSSEITREITHVSTPTAPSSAATKAYVDSSASNIIAPTRTNAIPIVTGENSVAIGGANNVPNVYSVAIGRDAFTSRDSEVSIGDPGTGTRYLASVRDPNLTHDAANKHYVDTTTSNALTATVTDTLVTVDDAVTQAPLSLSFKGVARQDGTPSVDNPVEVQVVTTPQVTVAGKNLFDISLLVVGKAIDSNTGAVYTQASGIWCATVDFIVVNNLNGKTLFATGLTASTTSSFFFYDSKGVKIDLQKTTAKSFALTVPTGAEFMRVEVPIVTYNAGKIMLERGTVATAYEPYSGQSVSITLPAEHPYLASLPDGTADEVVINAYGNATLVARVGKAGVTIASANSEMNQSGSDGTLNYLLSATLSDCKVQNGGEGYSNLFPNGKLTKDRNTARFGASNSMLYIYHNIKELNQGVASAQEWMDAHNMYVVYPIATIKTYNLGKVSLPSLKVGVSNVWIDGGMGGAITMTYKQDANKVIASLKSAIAALTGKTASDEASANEQTIESDPDYSTGEPTTE